MQINFAIIAIPAGLRFYTAHDSNLMLFGWVSMGIVRDSLRLSYMPDLQAAVTEAAEPAPRFVKTAEEAAQFFAGLLKAEVGEERLAEIRAEWSGDQMEFAAYEITVPGNKWIGELCLAQAFEYASGGRAQMIGESAEDDAFALRLFDAFAEAFFAAETVEA